MSALQAIAVAPVTYASGWLLAIVPPSLFGTPLAAPN